MRTARIQQVDVSKVASFIEQSGQVMQPIDLVLKGRVVGRMIPPLNEPSPREQGRGWREIQRIQRKVGRMMKMRGKTEDEFDRILRKDT